MTPAEWKDGNNRYLAASLQWLRLLLHRDVHLGGAPFRRGELAPRRRLVHDPFDVTDASTFSGRQSGESDDGNPECRSHRLMKLAESQRQMHLDHRRRHEDLENDDAERRPRRVADR